MSRLNGLRERTWQEARKGKAIDEMWLAQQLRPYGVHPRTMRIGAAVGKGYDLDELEGLFRGYITAEDLAALQELVGR